MGSEEWGGSRLLIHGAPGAASAHLDDTWMEVCPLVECEERSREAAKATLIPKPPHER